MAKVIPSGRRAQDRQVREYLHLVLHPVSVTPTLVMQRLEFQECARSGLVAQRSVVRDSRICAPVTLEFTIPLSQVRGLG